MPRRLGVVVGWVVLSVAAVAAIQDRVPDAFRGRVTVVSVDVYPVRDGRIVPDLSRGDFEVFEDGKPQAIDTFEFVKVDPGEPGAARRDPNTQEEGDRLAADPHNRVFVLYLDIYHTTRFGAINARQPLLDFVHRTIAPQDLFAVMTPEVPVAQMVFGRDPFTLEQELRGSNDWGLADQIITPLGRPPEEAMLETCAGASLDGGDLLVSLYREDQLMSNLEALMIRLRNVREERKHLLLVSEGWIPRTPDLHVSAMAGSDIPTIGVGPGGRLGPGVPRDRVGQSDSWCATQIRRLASIDFERRFRDLLSLAQRANVSVHPIDVGGLRTSCGTQAADGGAARGPRRGADLAMGGHLGCEPALLANPRTTLLTLADHTGGRAIYNTNDPGIGLAALSDQLSSYYLLGYRSSNPALDGKYRRIEVKVRRPEIKVTARDGYLAAVEAPAAISAPAVPEPVTTELGRLARLRPDAGISHYAAAGSEALDVVIEIPEARASRSEWRDGARVEVRALGSSGNAAAATARIDPGGRTARVRLSRRDVGAGPWHVSVRAIAAAGELTDRFDVADAVPGASVLGTPIVFKTTGSGTVPVADFLFRRTDRVRIAWPVAKPVDERLARVLDRRGQPLAVPVTVAESAGVIAADLTLGAMAEGDYLVELTIRSGGRSEQDLLAFRVTR